MLIDVSISDNSLLIIPLDGVLPGNEWSSLDFPELSRAAESPGVPFEEEIMSSGAQDGGRHSQKGILALLWNNSKDLMNRVSGQALPCLPHPFHTFTVLEPGKAFVQIRQALVRSSTFPHLPLINPSDSHSTTRAKKAISLLEKMKMIYSALRRHLVQF